jgi:hypothetical protein
MNRKILKNRITDVSWHVEKLLSIFRKESGVVVGTGSGVGVNLFL